jgi:SMC interacting uncharacterized protein involved in chromosome segregation
LPAKGPQVNNLIVEPETGDEIQGSSLANDDPVEEGGGHVEEEDLDHVEEEDNSVTVTKSQIRKISEDVPVAVEKENNSPLGARFSGIQESIKEVDESERDHDTGQVPQESSKYLALTQREYVKLQVESMWSKYDLASTRIWISRMHVEDKDCS